MQMLAYPNRQYNVYKTMKTPASKGKEVKHYIVKTDCLNDPPAQPFVDFVEQLRIELLRLYNQQHYTPALGNKTLEDVIIAFKKYDALDVSKTLKDNNILYNFNKFGNTINQWFPEMPDTKVETKGGSLIDTIRNKDRFHHLMVMFFLEDRMHCVSHRVKLDNRKYELKIPHYVMDENTRQKYTILPHFGSVLRLGLGQPVCNFPAAISKYIFWEAIDRVEHDGENLIFFDPCCGWGSRLIGLLANNDKLMDGEPTYIINDPNEFTHGRFKSIYQFWNKEIADVNITVIKTKLPAQDLLYDKYYKSLISKVNVVFTSPPYFNREMYDKDNPLQSHNRYNNYQLWKQKFLRAMLANIYELLAPNGLFYLNIASIGNKPIQEDALSLAKEIGYQLVDTYNMALTPASGSNKNKQTTKHFRMRNAMMYNGKYYKTQPIYVLKKSIK